MTQKLTGGCHYQAIRYEVESIFDAGYCHCSICRKLSGAPVLAWANIKPKVHICASDRVAWLELNDSLPRYENNTLPPPDKRREKF
jgi:hypothetical protein